MSKTERVFIIALIVAITIAVFAYDTRAQGEEPFQTFAARGRVTDRFGRGVPRFTIRSQSAICDLEPEGEVYVFEQYTITNSFGYFSVRLRSDCHTFSVRELGAKRLDERNVWPRIYAFTYVEPPPAVLYNFDFQEVANGLLKWK